MDCRKFHRNLEDYLEDGLDFPGRFGMERHAQQCISCAREMDGAQQLRRLARELERIKAPANFESAVLNEILKRKAESRFSRLRDFWLYGFEWPSMRKLALASSGVAVLAIAMFYASAHFSGRAVSVQTAPVKMASEQLPRPSLPAAEEPIKMVESSGPVSEIKAVRASSMRETPSNPLQEVPQLADATPPARLEREQIANEESTDSDYLEIQFGPETHPVSFRLPNKTHIRYGPNPQEYFIRNISH